MFSFKNIKLNNCLWFYAPVTKYNLSIMIRGISKQNQQGAVITAKEINPNQTSHYLIKSRKYIKHYANYSKFGPRWLAIWLGETNVSKLSQDIYSDVVGIVQKIDILC